MFVYIYIYILHVREIHLLKNPKKILHTCDNPAPCLCINNPAPCLLSYCIVNIANIAVMSILSYCQYATLHKHGAGLSIHKHGAGLSDFIYLRT